jgi:hypothetical protein
MNTWDHQDTKKGMNTKNHRNTKMTLRDNGNERNNSKAKDDTTRAWRQTKKFKNIR